MDSVVVDGGIPAIFRCAAELTMDAPNQLPPGPGSKRLPPGSKDQRLVLSRERGDDILRHHQPCLEPCRWPNMSTLSGGFPALAFAHAAVDDSAVVKEAARGACGSFLQELLTRCPGEQRIEEAWCGGKCWCRRCQISQDVPTLMVQLLQYKLLVVHLCSLA